MREINKLAPWCADAWMDSSRGPFVPEKRDKYLLLREVLIFPQ
jgi:hypothetical protein